MPSMGYLTRHAFDYMHDVEFPMVLQLLRGMLNPHYHMA